MIIKIKQEYDNKVDMHRKTRVYEVKSFSINYKPNESMTLFLDNDIAIDMNNKDCVYVMENGKTVDRYIFIKE